MDENPYEPPAPCEVTPPPRLPPVPFMQTVVLYLTTLAGAFVSGLYLTTLLGVSFYPYTLVDFIAGALVGAGLSLLGNMIGRRLLAAGRR